MATLERIRNKGGILVAFFIGFALLAFILTDFFKQNGGGQPNSIEIGEINGTTISLAAYQNEITKAEDFQKLRTNQSSIDENTQYQIRDNVWNQMVMEVILSEIYESNGLGVSTDEIVDMTTGNNVHPAIRQMFTNPQTGQFDQNLVINFLKNRKADPNSDFYWNYLQELLIKEKLESKYKNLFIKGIAPTSIQTKKEAELSKRSVDFDFVAVSYSSIPDSTVNVSDSEIQKYYNKHKEDYKQDAERTIEYITYEVKPSAEDKNMAEQWIKDTKSEFSSPDINAEQFVTMNSDVPFNDKNLNESELRISLKDFVVNAKEGDVFGPYFEDNAYKLTRVVSIKEMPDSVRARHILIQETTPTASHTVADSLMNLINNGGDFAELARNNSKDNGSAINGGDLNWFREGMMVKPFNDACFNGKKGDVVKVETQYGVHIINIQDLGKLTTKYKLATLARDIKYSSKTFQQVYSEANKFAANNNTTSKFLEAIKSENISTRTATLKQNDKSVSGLENSRTLVQWAFESDVNDMTSTIYTFGNKFVIGIVTAANEKGYKDYKSPEVYNSIKAIVAKDKKADILKKKFIDNTASSQSLSSLAKKMESTVQTATGVNFASYQVPGVGPEASLIGLASVAEVGKISQPVKGNRYVFVVKVTSEKISDSDNSKSTKRQIEQNYNSKLNYSFIPSIKEKADIEDNRSEYF